MGEAFKKAISREAHAYQGVVYGLELCDDGGECASLDYAPVRSLDFYTNETSVNTC